MPYIKLSEQIEKLTNPQRSDTFVKQLRNAVREGAIDAADIQGRFQLPKQFGRRGTTETYQRDVRDIVIEVTPAFTEWFDSVNKELAPARTGGKVQPTIENIESGAVDFQAMAAETRRRMEASYTKGQHLGNSRSTAKAKSPGKTPAKRSVGRPKK